MRDKVNKTTCMMDKVNKTRGMRDKVNKTRIRYEGGIRLIRRGIRLMTRSMRYKVNKTDEGQG